MFLEIGAGTVESAAAADNRVTYYANAGGGIEGFQGSLGGPVNEALRRVRLARLGIDVDQHPEVLASVPLERMNLVSKDPSTGKIQEARKINSIENFGLPFIMFFLLMMVVMAGSMPMIGAVAEDKLQRVFEMLLASASPFEIITGKVLAALGLSLTSSILYVAGGLLVLQSMAMMGMAPLSLLPWFFAYLVADVLMLAAMGAGLGAATSTPQEAQNLAIFLIAPVVIPSVLSPAILQQPNGVTATVLSLIPPFTPLLMMLRQAMPGGVPAWQPWVGLAGVILWTLAITWGAARVFRVGLLMQGKPPNLRELLQWARRG
jgi:ABC-2 type transport system permease protein